MTLPKFILTIDGYLRLGYVYQHYELLLGDDQCIGGGYFLVENATNRLLLDRKSYEFGRPRWHLVETLKVPEAYRGLRIEYDYDDHFHETFVVSEELKIEYY